MGRPACDYSKGHKDSLETIEGRFTGKGREYLDSLFTYNKEDILEALGKDRRGQEEKYSQIVCTTKEIINSCNEQEIEAYRDWKIAEYTKKTFLCRLEHRKPDTWDNKNLDEEKLTALILALGCNVEEYGQSQKNLKPFVKVMLRPGRKKLSLIREMLEECYIRDPYAYAFFYQDIENAEKRLFIWLVRRWKDVSENMGQQEGFLKVKNILLCKNDEDTVGCKEWLIKSRNDRYKDMEADVLRYYLDFLCADVFRKEAFWKMVYDDMEIRQEYLDSRLNTAMREKYSDLTIQKLFLGNTLISRENQWSCPKYAETVFEENFKKYRYQHCFYEMYTAFLDEGMLWQVDGEKVLLHQRSIGEEQLIRKSMAVNRGPKSVWSGGTPEDQISFKFQEWTSLYKLEQLYGSILHKVLGEILKDTRRHKKDYEHIRFDEKDGYYVEDGDRRRRLWGIPVAWNSLDTSLYTVDSYFSHTYQIKLKERVNTNEKRFDALVDDTLYMMECADFIEIYKWEDDNRVLTAWKMYDTVFELASWPNKNPGNKELNQAIYKLASSIGGIKDLELRLAVLDGVKGMIPQIREGYYENVVEGVLRAADTVNELSEEFNSVYEETFSALLWQFAKKRRWKQLLWMRNRETEGLSRLVLETRKMRDKRKNNESQCKFDDLYSIRKASGEKYHLYRGILEHLQAGCADSP